MVHTPFQNIKVRFHDRRELRISRGRYLRHQRDDDFRCARTNDEIFTVTVFIFTLLHAVSLSGTEPHDLFNIFQREIFASP